MSARAMVYRIARCLRCDVVRKCKARGLCFTCYDAPGAREQFPTTRRTLADFADDYKILSARGLGRTEIAEKLGYKQRSVLRMVSRARAAGLLPPYQPVDIFAIPAGVR